MCTTIIMVHKGTRAVPTGRSTASGFDLACLVVTSKHVCVFGLHGAVYAVKNYGVTSFFLPVTELSLVGLAWLTNHCPSLL